MAAVDRVILSGPLTAELVSLHCVPERACGRLVQIGELMDETVEKERAPSFSWRRFFAVAGPGVVVMLADTDAGSVITAAQSGAQWGYGLLALQAVLIPILYIVQELTVRLGMVTGKGHAELIKQHFGSAWAWVSVVTLIIC